MEKQPKKMTNYEFIKFMLELDDAQKTEQPDEEPFLSEKCRKTFEDIVNENQKFDENPTMGNIIFNKKLKAAK